MDDIRRTIADAERHQSDLDPFVALHTEDVVVVNLAGRRVLGRAALRDAMAAALDSPLADVTTRSDVEDIRLVSPDVAIVSCLKHVSGLADELTARLTYVLVRQPDRWRIAVAQTTPITAPFAP
ncbi:hypothetical protein GCM10022243_57550 [Saccharothrix violaceirubra]|uniref:Uncharacterized protein (TIGR02246 family) n=1 Tax=Saccharothrix violaceirubra TaxID=413306 RepID=A0A7W7T3D3_9PSEU|nr:SgcJ/EcaC family oxidoreductase [Saccharothrix violaceirubra]MBB4965813.1 uncharacterized protein (TIGR02246 family) [Saccharothrix violaceirubra]